MQTGMRAGQSHAHAQGVIMQCKQSGTLRQGACHINSKAKLMYARGSIRQTGPRSAVIRQCRIPCAAACRGKGKITYNASEEMAQSQQGTYLDAPVRMAVASLS